MQDPASKQWYLGVSEMSEHCGLGTWGSNSRCVMAVSTTGPAGPYTRQQVVIDPWCHGASLARDHLSGRWIYGYVLLYGVCVCVYIYTRVYEYVYAVYDV